MQLLCGQLCSFMYVKMACVHKLASIGQFPYTNTQIKTSTGFEVNTLISHHDDVLNVGTLGRK